MWKGMNFPSLSAMYPRDVQTLEFDFGLVTLGSHTLTLHAQYACNGVQMLHTIILCGEYSPPPPPNKNTFP